MTLSDFDQFSVIIAGMAEMYGKPITAAGIKMYWAVLHKRWDLGDFAAAAGDLCGTCQFMPTAKDFEDLRNKGKMTPGEAWTIARSMSMSCIHHGAVTAGGSCGNEFIDRVVKAVGGYRTIFMANERDIGFIERRFAEHYESMMDAEDTRERLPQITSQATGAGTGLAIGHAARGQAVPVSEILPTALLRRQAE